MLTFQLEQPFTQADIDSVIDTTEKKNAVVIKKIQIMGFVVLAATIIGGSLWDIRFNKPEDFNKIMTLFLPLTFGLFSVLHPYIKRFVFGQPLNDYITFEYLPASTITSRNCEAFIQMPGMENYKAYAEKVKQQGRSLTNLECEAIIKHYESLV